VGVDHETFITPIPTFPRQGGRQLRVLDPIARGSPPEGEGFPPSTKGTLMPDAELFLHTKQIRLWLTFPLFSELTDSSFHHPQVGGSGESRFHLTQSVKWNTGKNMEPHG
jgi:hypothetical protein